MFGGFALILGRSYPYLLGVVKIMTNLAFRQNRINYTLLIYIILSVFVLSYCVPASTEIPVKVIVVTELPPDFPPEASSDLPPGSLTEVIPEIPIEQFSVYADAPIYDMCSCNGTPIGVSVTLRVSGGVSPYSLDGYENKSFTDSYVIPIDKNIRSLTITVNSGDGQQSSTKIVIPSCTPPPNCTSDNPSIDSNYNPNDGDKDSFNAGGNANINNNSNENVNANVNTNDDTNVKPTPCPTNPSGNSPPGKCK